MPRVGDEGVCDFLADRSRQVQDLAVGDFCLWCGGWSGVNGGHAIMYMVDKVSSSKCDWVTFNTGQGVGNHPDFAAGYPKQKRYTQMRLCSTTEKVADPAWLWIVFKIQAGGHKDHTPEMMYDVALPALMGILSCARVRSARASRTPTCAGDPQQAACVITVAFSPLLQPSAPWI